MFAVDCPAVSRSAARLSSRRSAGRASALKVSAVAVGDQVRLNASRSVVVGQASDGWVVGERSSFPARLLRFCFFELVLLCLSQAPDFALKDQARVLCG